MVELNTPEGVTNLSKEELEEHLRRLQRPITLSELAEILDTTIKHDVENKVITFLAMLLNYTSQDQMNVAFNAESSTGKSYIPLELSAYFPEEDLMIQGYTSPTAFYHESGEWDSERHVKVIDLRQKILIFVDMPHDQLLQKLRPLLSHDKRVITHKITDRSKKLGLQTKSIEIIGYPTVVFCSTRFTLEDQERTRLLLLSPEVAPEKILDAIRLLSHKLSHRPLFREFLEQDEGRRFLRDRVQAVRSARISEVVIPETLRERIVDRFLTDHPNLIPRHQRDFPRLIGMIKAHALLNLYQRERFKDVLLVTEEDITAGYNLYQGISRSNELGIPPEVYNFYEKVFKPQAHDEGKATRRDLSGRYYRTYHKTIGKKRLNKTIELLLESGLIVEDKDPDDRRINVYSHPEGYISNTKLAKFTPTKYPSTCENPGDDGPGKNSGGA